MPNEYGQIPTHLPFHTGMPPNYQHFMDNINPGNFQQYPSVSPSKLTSAINGMSLQQQNPAINNIMQNAEPNIPYYNAQLNQNQGNFQAYYFNYWLLNFDEINFYQGLSHLNSQQYHTHFQQPQNGQFQNNQSQNNTVNNQVINGQNGHMTPATSQLPVINGKNTSNLQLVNSFLPHVDEQVNNNQLYYQQPKNEQNQVGLIPPVQDAQLISFD